MYRLISWHCSANTTSQALLLVEGAVMFQRSTRGLDTVDVVQCEISCITVNSSVDEVVRKYISKFAPTTATPFQILAHIISASISSLRMKSGLRITVFSPR